MRMTKNKKNKRGLELATMSPLHNNKGRYLEEHDMSAHYRTAGSYSLTSLT